VVRFLGSSSPVTIRCCPYLNNIVEQDHRRIKFRVHPMLGFKRFYNARRVIAGIELAQKTHKDQFQIPERFGSNPMTIWGRVNGGLILRTAGLNHGSANLGSLRDSICSRTPAYNLVRMRNLMEATP
jgi:hypothetical protein